METKKMKVFCVLTRDERNDVDMLVYGSAKEFLEALKATCEYHNDINAYELFLDEKSEKEMQKEMEELNPGYSEDIIIDVEQLWTLKIYEINK